MCAIGLQPCRLVGSPYTMVYHTVMNGPFSISFLFLPFFLLFLLYLLLPYFLSPSSRPLFLHSLPPSGDGKTHYIKQQLAHSPASLTIAVNEAFTPLNAIYKLRALPLNQKNCAIFFNFTMLPPGVRV